MASSSAQRDIFDDEYYEEEILVDEDSSWVEWEIPVDVENFSSSQRDHPFDESTLASESRFSADREQKTEILPIRGARDPPETLTSHFCDGGEQKTEILPICGGRDPPEARYDQLQPTAKFSGSISSSISEAWCDQQQLTAKIVLSTSSTKSEETCMGIPNIRIVQKPLILPDEEQPSSEFGNQNTIASREEQAPSTSSRTEDQASLPALDSSIVRWEEDSIIPQQRIACCEDNVAVPSIVRREEHSVIPQQHIACYEGTAAVQSEYGHANMFQGTVERKRKPSWKVCILMLLYLVFIVVLVLAILYFVIFRENDDGANEIPTLSPTGSTEWLPAVSCSGRVTTLTAETIAKYETLTTELLVPSLYSTWEHDIKSCHPANQAMLWLSSEHKAADPDDTTDLIQRWIMSFLFFSSGGADWPSQNQWLSQHDVCDWEGLGCTSNGDLMKMNLVDNSLKGHVISELGFLSTLQILNLQHNALSGSLPFEVASLAGLQIIDVSRNALGGKIPSQIGASALEQLSLSRNSFSGSIPTQLGLATLIKKFDVSHNNLGGKVPTQLNLLSKLSYLNMGGNNHITGQLSTEYGRFTDLAFLSISNTAIQTRIPKQYAALSNLEELRMANTLVGGDIPQAIASMTNLRHLDLSTSRFRNSIPSFIGSLSKLTHLSLHNNSFTGPIPTKIGLLSHIRMLTLHDNLLSGTVPSECASISNLEVFTLHHSFLTGRIPENLCSLRDMELNVFTVPCPTQTAQGLHLGITCSVPNCCSACIGPLQSSNP